MSKELLVLKLKGFIDVTEFEGPMNLVLYLFEHGLIEILVEDYGKITYDMISTWIDTKGISPHTFLVFRKSVCFKNRQSGDMFYTSHDTLQVDTFISGMRLLMGK